MLSTRGGKSPPPPSLAPHSTHPGKPTRSASPSPRGCRGQGLCLGPESGSLGLTAPRPGPSRNAEGTQEGPKKCVPPSRWACRSRPQPPAARHSPFPSWAPWCLDANTPCQRGLGAKGCAESVPPSVPLRERGQSGTSPGPRASCAVFRSVGVSHAAMTDFATPRTVAHQAPLSAGFSRQQYWSGLPFPSTGDLPNPGVEAGSPALKEDSFIV